MWIATVEAQGQEAREMKQETARRIWHVFLRIVKL